MFLLSDLSDLKKEVKEIKKQNKAFHIIKQYINITENPFPSLQPKNRQDVVWQFWEPPKTTNCSAGLKLVSSCLESVQKNIWAGYKRELLDLSTSKKYVEFPDFVYQKLQDNRDGFGFTAFSDILRLALLYKFGGIWLDASILVLQPLGTKYIFYKHGTGFSFARSPNVSSSDRRTWRHYDPTYFSWSRFSRIKWLNSFIISGENTKIIEELLRILLLIWKYEHRYPHYFTTQIIYNHLAKINASAAFSSQSDIPIHYLQRHLNEKFNTDIYNHIKRSCPLQKMSWKIHAPKLPNQDTFFDHIIQQKL